MTPDQARALYLDHCTVGGMEQYGEKAAVAAIMALLPSLLEGCDGIESGPNGRGGMRVVVHFTDAPQEYPLFRALHDAFHGVQS